MMITFENGLKFGKGEDSLIDSLFNSTTTNDGWYTVTGRKYKTVRFFTGNGKPLFYIVSNKHGITSGNLSTNNGKFYYIFFVLWPIFCCLLLIRSVNVIYFASMASGLVL